MAIVGIIVVLTFCAILCYIEIPKILQRKSMIEFWSFTFLLLLGTVLSILKYLNVPISNPSDWLAWVYSPVRNLLKAFLEMS